MKRPEGPGIPSEERRRRGRVAVIECFQRIPCDPCRTACPHGAITFENDITSLPVLDGEKCTGCGLCAARCPGLAIFLVDESHDPARVCFPYEYLPAPKTGDEVACTDRMGQFVTRGRVVSCAQAPAFDRTALVTVEVPRGYAMDVRGIDRHSIARGGGDDD